MKILKDGTEATVDNLDRETEFPKPMLRLTAEREKLVFRRRCGARGRVYLSSFDPEWYYLYESTPDADPQGPFTHKGLYHLSELSPAEAQRHIEAENTWESHLEEELSAGRGKRALAVWLSSL